MFRVKKCFLGLPALAAVLGVPVVELWLVPIVSIARGPGVLLRPAGRGQVGGGGRGPGTVPAALLRVGVGRLLLTPHVVNGWPGVGWRLGSEQFPGFLRVSLLQIRPLVAVPVLKRHRILALFL